MKKRLILSISFLLILHIFIFPQTFNVVFLANTKYAENPQWLNQIKNWGATGINYRIFRHILENKDHTINSNEWHNITKCLKLISDSKLDMFIRVNMFNLPKGYWPDYNKDDYQQTVDGIMYSTYLSDNIPTLNLTSPIALRDRIHFFQTVIDSLNSQPASIRSRIKLIVPTLSQDDETGLMLNRKFPPEGKGTWGWLSGYSEIEQDTFIKYLEDKYLTVSNLNAAWSTSFTGINRAEIKIKEYGWENIEEKYFCSEGRRDFIDFLTGQLKNFIDTCATIVHTANENFEIGVQFGSVYDGGIEFGAFYDVTFLLEKVDMVICDDVAEYQPNFNFAADYLRSICNYWNWKRGNYLRPLNFGTETNWPGYNHIIPDTLVKYRQMQLQSYYDRRASTLFISHWGTIDLDVTWLPDKPLSDSDPYLHFTIGDLIINDELTSDGPYIQSQAYFKWKSTLNHYRTLKVKTISSKNCVVHLSPARVLTSKTNGSQFDHHIHNIGDSVSYIPTFDGKHFSYSKLYRFPIYKFTNLNSPHSTYTFYNEDCDIITDYMIEKSPEYFLETYNTNH